MYGYAYVRSVFRNIAQCSLGRNVDDVLLELLGSNFRNGESGVLGRLERDEVGQKTSDVRRSHRGTGDGVDGVLAASPHGQDVETRGENVSALPVVGEVGTLISKSGGANSDDLLRSSGGRVTGVTVVVTGSHSEVETSVDTSVDSHLQNRRLSTTQTHVGNATLEALGLAFLGSLDLLGVSLNSPLDTLDDIGHGTRARGPEDLDSVDVRLLGNAILLTRNSTRAVGTVAIAILVSIASRDSLAPVSTTLKVDMIGVDTSVNGVGINSLTTIRSVEVLVEGAERETIPVGNTSKTPGSALLDLRVFHSVDFGVFLNEIDLISSEAP